MHEVKSIDRALGFRFWVLGSGFWVLGLGFWVLGSIWVLPGGYHESVFHFVYDSYIRGARVCDYNDDATGGNKGEDDDDVCWCLLLFVYFFVFFGWILVELQMGVLIFPKSIEFFFLNSLLEAFRSHPLCTLFVWREGNCA